MTTIQEPTLNEYGSEIHPAFGMISAHRVSHGPPGKTLFDSEIKHQHYMVLTIHAASRKRDLNHDWLHPERQMFEVAMSEAQWASFVSSINTQGVACTIQATESELNVPELPYAPRMELQMKEATGAADEAFSKIKEAMATYEEKKTAANLRNLHFAIENATANVNYAGKKLGEHAEGVVQRARADVEAMVYSKAKQLGIDSQELMVALPMGQSDQEVDSDG